LDADIGPNAAFVGGQIERPRGGAIGLPSRRAPVAHPIPVLSDAALRGGRRGSCPAVVIEAGAIV
jgi:hypothetical protein